MCIMHYIKLIVDLLFLSLHIFYDKFDYRYMVDSADHEKLEASKNELHSLLDKPQLANIPVSVTIVVRDFI